MRSYQRLYGAVALRFGVLLLLYQLARLCFYLCNLNYFQATPGGQVLQLFCFGTRFDVAVLAYLNVFFVLLYLVPASFVYRLTYRKALDWCVIVFNSLILLFSFIDCEYFKFVNKRSTFDFFEYIFMSDDVLVLMPQFISDYWFIPLLWFAVSALGAWLFVRIRRYEGVLTPHRWPWVFLFVPQLLLTIGLLVVAGRGTGMKPINIITAARYTSSANFPLILNTSYTMMHTMANDGVSQTKYMSDEEARQIFNPVKTFNTDQPQKRDNVVVFILESFSSSYIGYLSGKHSYTPFFDSLLAQSMVFTNAYANGKKSIDAPPSVFASIPELLGQPYITSQFEGNALMGLPAALQQQGYNTSFFHGARNGTFHFNDFCKAVGCEAYYGLNEYSGPDAYDGDWGIFDEEFLQFFLQKIDSFPKPFFSSVFTLSSHHPYTIPARYKGTFKGGDLPIHISVEYADYALRRFFAVAQTKPWFKNTLFVFTADHAAQEEDYSKQKYTNNFHIPIALYHPGDAALRGKRLEVVQQADIMPTVLDYLNITGSYVCFGNSMFDSTASQRFALQRFSGIYSFIGNQYYIQWDGSQIIAAEPVNESITTPCDSATAQILLTRCKAVVQQYNQRLANNALVLKK